ncbi:MAG: ImmA/IrrE family metallo-endopeptidase [Nitrososphaera sp.]
MTVDYPQFGTLESPIYRAIRVKQMAQRIRVLAGQSEQRTFDPFAFARKIGVDVQSVDLPETCSGRLRTDKGYALIEIRAEEPRVRQRFTLCHELAHICFWSAGPVVKERGQVIPGPSKFVLEEQLCDQIASELLMPSGVFTSLAKREIPSYESIRRLAQHFDVSILAIMRKITKTTGHGWISGSLEWTRSQTGTVVRSGDVRLGTARQRGVQRQLRARDTAKDAFKRAERIFLSDPWILTSLKHGYVTLAMPSPEVTIWRRRTPKHLGRLIHGVVFFGL